MLLYAAAGGILVILAFYTGFLQGKQNTSVQAVTLACKDDVLSKLSIPLEKISNGVVAHAESTAAQGKYVGSKNSTKYYLPSCPAAKRIKPANYQWFSSADDAQLQGYTPGKC